MPLSSRNRSRRLMMQVRSVTVLYANLRGRVYGIYMFSTDVQADQLNATLDFGNRNGFPHRWDGFLDTDYTIRDIWQGYYSGLVNVNNAITNLPTITPATDAEAATLNAYIGEAYLMRAYYYHQLILRWGKAIQSGNGLF
jgi:starch-binding outer membrane protein, SusD/RagB family